MSILNPLFEAVAWVMMRIHAGLAVPFGASTGLTWALSIVILVVLMRLIMLPLFIKQVKSQRKMQAHMPQLREIQKRYKGDKQRQQEEMMKFYKENGINPLGGCLPLVAQLPMFWALFNVLEAIASWNGGTPRYGLTVPVVQSARNAKIFGAVLSDKVLFTGTLHVPVQAKLVIVIFVLVSAGTTFLTMRQSQRRGMMQQPGVDPDNPAANMTKYMMYISPLFALTGLYWQFGLVIYWVTTNVWTLGQQFILFRNLPMVASTTADSSTAPASRPAPAASAAAGPGSARPAAKPASAKPAAARPSSARAGANASANGTSPAARSTAAKPAAASSRPAPAARDKSGANGAAVRPAGAKAAVRDGQGSGARGGLLRFGKAKAEPEPEPAAETRVIRQQPVRQTRSKRSGKR